MTAQSSPPAAPGAAPVPLAEVDLAIEGMTCASCVARVEKRLNRVDGVTATVNLPLETAHVALAADVSDANLVAAVEKAGYTARVTTRRPLPNPTDQPSTPEDQGSTSTDEVSTSAHQGSTSADRGSTSADPGGETAAEAGTGVNTTQQMIVAVSFTIPAAMSRLPALPMARSPSTVTSSLMKRRRQILRK